VPALRAALDCADDPVLSGLPMAPVELRTKLDECERDRSRYAQMAVALPELLQHAYVLAADARAGFQSEAVGRVGQVRNPEQDEPSRAGRYWIDVAAPGPCTAAGRKPLTHSTGLAASRRS
jgi:hypothetical protein